MSYDFLAGIVVAMVFDVVALFLFLRLGRPSSRISSAQKIANKLLLERNRIGRRQAEAMESIAAILNDGGEPGCTKCIDALTVIRTVATAPHHENAFAVIRELCTTALNSEHDEH